MRSLSTNSPHQANICLALTDFADEVSGTLARLFAYVGTLALFGILALHALDEWQAMGVVPEPAAKPGWAVADRSYPAFAVSQIDPTEKSVSYTILRHPEGGRKDLLRWIGADGAPIAELEIYRPGGEFDDNRPAGSHPAEQMTTAVASGLEQAGVVDSKFGAVALSRRSGSREGDRSCLGFSKRLDPGVLMSGWSCQGQTLPARRAAIACTLDRLTLLASGNEPKLAELFARAELRRGARCAGRNTTSADWVTSTANPRLRGAL
jgi:hypothetical protein